MRAKYYYAYALRPQSRLVVVTRELLRNEMAMPDGYIPPNVEPKCTWSLGKRKDESPHEEFIQKPRDTGSEIMSNVLEMIGQTPLVRLDKIAKSEGLQCDLLAKCEFLNAGGSVKDRIGLRMVEEAERNGTLKPGDTLIEPTSGNTGIGLALTAAVKGYRCVIVMPEKMSGEKVAVLRALGAEIVRTPTSASFNTPESHIGVSWKLKNEIPNSHVLDQYRNAGNPLAHYDGTGNEILAQTGGNVDVIVCGAGTGGTVCGIGKKVKEVAPNCKIIAVDPYGSILAQPDELNVTDVTSYHVEGTGYDFIPTVFDRSVVDEWYKSGDDESFHYARRLIKEEGLLCGGSSGAVLAAALKAAKNLKAGQRCVLVLPDSIRNYLSKFVSDDWMIEHGFMEPPPADHQWWWDKPISELKLQPHKISTGTTCSQAISHMKENSLLQVTVVSDKGRVMGVINVNDIAQKMLNGQCKGSQSVMDAEKLVTQKYKQVDFSSTMKQLYDELQRSEYAVIQKGGEEFCGVATMLELVEYSDNHKH